MPSSSKQWRELRCERRHALVGYVDADESQDGEFRETLPGSTVEVSVPDIICVKCRTWTWTKV